MNNNQLPRTQAVWWRRLEDMQSDGSDWAFVKGYGKRISSFVAASDRKQLPKVIYNWQLLHRTASSKESWCRDSWYFSVPWAWLISCEVWLISAVLTCGCVGEAGVAQSASPSRLVSLLLQALSSLVSASIIPSCSFTFASVVSSCSQQLVYVVTDYY